MYQLTDTTSIKRLSDGAWIPADPRNDDYKAYLAWVSQGNAAQPGPTLPNPRIAEIKQALAAIDDKKVRALTDAALIGDKTRLQALETQAATLRTELDTL